MLRVGFGTLVWSLRTQAGLTQAHLAQRAGLSEWMIRELEHGRVRPSDATCATLAAGLRPQADPITVAMADLDLQAAAGPSLDVRQSRTPASLARTRRSRTATQRRRQRRERDAALLCAIVLQLIESTPANPFDYGDTSAMRTEQVAPGGSNQRRLLSLTGGPPGQRPAL